MRIVTNPGSNLPDSAVRHFGIEVSPQQIVVDGVSHDTRVPVPFGEIDGWVRGAKEYPYVVGTTAHEFAALFAALAREGHEILALLASRKIIQTHAAAVSAARTLTTSAAFRKAQVQVVDSQMTDAGLGLLVLAAAAMGSAGHPLATVVRTLQLLAERAFFAFVPGTLERLVKGGRAGWARAHVADFLKIKPIIGFQTGELEQLGRVRGSGDLAGALLDLAAKRVGSARNVWVSAFHSCGDDVQARELLTRARRAFPVEYATVRPVTPSIYVHVGPRALGLAVVPMGDLPIEVPVPPDFRDT